MAARLISPPAYLPCFSSGMTIVAPRAAWELEFEDSVKQDILPQSDPWAQLWTDSVGRAGESVLPGSHEMQFGTSRRLRMSSGGGLAILSNNVIVGSTSPIRFVDAAP
jgi:hypothetical protein